MAEDKLRKGLLSFVFLVCFLTSAAALPECHCSRGCDDYFECKSGGDCLRGWSGPTCQIENIAFKKNTKQSSTANDCQWANDKKKRAHCGRKTSFLAVDGRSSSDYWSGTCIHTLPYKYPTWWSVDLGLVHRVSDMKIFFGNECTDGWFGDDCSFTCLCRNTLEVCDKQSGHCNSGCADGYSGQGCKYLCELGRYGSGCQGTCGRCAGGDENCHHVDGRCIHGCRSNWIREQCKECADRMYGDNCSTRCACRNPLEACDKVSGLCISGCRDGYTGESCQDLCKLGRYGSACTEECGSCYGGSINCDQVDGRCKNGCLTNWSGYRCKECDEGYFGPDCSERCGYCLRNASCKKTSGQCPKGCLPGWKGGRCLQECDERSYGLNCSHQCGHCVGHCHPVDGSCDSEGCMNGWTGQNCNEECPNGTYGNNCSQDCGECLSHDLCNKETGHCRHGLCDRGWKGPLCQEGCNSTGTYGYNCNETCGWCLREVCDAVTGHCPEGCHPMYEGDACQLKRPASVTTSSVGVAILFSLTGVLAVVLFVALFVFKRSRHRSSREKTNAMSHLSAGIDNAEFNQASTPRACRTNNTDGDNDDNPYVNAVSTTVKVSELRDYISRRNDKFKFEYGRLPNGLQHPHTVADRLGNKGKNRFKNMYPYDHSRVVLLETPGIKHSDYINASYIDSYSETKAHIATQGPNPATVGDFWRMVWQERSPIIVMLTRVAEGNRIKCEQYWPDEDKPMVRGDLQITNEGCVQKADFVIRELTVHNTKLDQKHHVTQVHYITWPDHDVPSAPVLVRFWKVFRSMAVLNKKPFIVHCSAGVGRTGTFIALDVLMGRVRDVGEVDVYDYVTRMREDRVNMVQTKEQYLFLHQVILEALYSDTTLMTPTTIDTLFTTDMQSSASEQSALQEQWKNLRELHRVLHDPEVGASLLPENIRKTRVKEILPADKYRPLLTLPAPETNDYINAVFVPSESRERGLVVSQLPLPWTVVDFWRLVIDHNIRTVVTLEPDASRIQADDVAPFWPETETEIICSPFVVSKIDTKYKHTTSISLQVWQKESAESSKHDVQLLHMSDWPESQDTPTQTSDFLHLLNEVNMLEKADSGPVVVMCRDGATRCGLFCAVYNIIQRLKADSDIDIYLTARQLQTIRPNFLPSYVQYQFCYQMVKEFQKTFATVYENFQA